MSCRPRYVNARSVLPPDLLEAVQAKVGPDAVTMWVPGSAAQRAVARAAQVLEMSRRGMPVRDIAEAVGLSGRRVYQIIATNRGES